MTALDKVFEDHPQEAQDFAKLKKKRTGLINYLVGQTMKATPTFDVHVVREMIERKIDANDN